MATNPIDAHVGKRLRLRRTLTGMSQERLGKTIGLTFQQVQKYEKGINRIGAGRLYDLAQILDVPVSYFYDDLPNGQAIKSDASDRELLEVAKAVAALSKPHRKLVVQLARLLKSVEVDDDE